MRKLTYAFLLAALAGTCSAADINGATARDLQHVNGISERLATRIVKERLDNGDYKDWADLGRRVDALSGSAAQKASDGGLLVRGNTYTPETAGKTPSRAPDSAGAPPPVVPAEVKTKESASTSDAPPAVGAPAPGQGGKN